MVAAAESHCVPEMIVRVILCDKDVSVGWLAALGGGALPRRNQSELATEVSLAFLPSRRRGKEAGENGGEELLSGSMCSPSAPLLMSAIAT